MTNTEESKKELKKTAGLNSQCSNNKALCDSLVSRMIEKNNKKSKSNVKLPYRSEKNKTNEMSDTEVSEKLDEESEWLSVFTSSASRKSPPIFEKSNSLYKKQKQKEALKRSRNCNGKPMNFRKRIT